MQSTAVRQDEAKVLVADDPSLARGWVAGCLATAGYDVISASDGEEVVDGAITQDPDLILLDATMPRLSNELVCRRLKEAPETAAIPVVLMIDHNHPMLRQVNEDRVYDALLYKPVGRRELLTCAASMLGSRRMSVESDPMAQVLYGLSVMLEARDPDTKGHLERVGEYAFRLAAKLGLPEKRCESLRRAAMLHDIGKLGVNDSVLFKPGPLSDEEYGKMKWHSVFAEEVLKRFGSKHFDRRAILHHHERWDGTGFPDGLEAEDIPLTARILTLADAYDALVSDRPYRKALAPAEAAFIIRQEKGKRFDPALVDSFLQMIEL